MLSIGRGSEFGVAREARRRKRVCVVDKSEARLVVNCARWHDGEDGLRSRERETGDI